MRRRQRVLCGALACCVILDWSARVAAAQEPAPDAALPDALPRGEDARTLSPEESALAGRLQVVYWPGGEERARRLLEVVGSRPGLPGLPDSIPTRAIFYLAPDPAVWDFLTGGEIPEWGAGVAIPSRRIAVLPLFDSPAGGLGSRDRTALHEWAHLGLHEYLDGLRIPRWFDEGYAQRVEGGWNVERAWRLRLALAGGGAPPLDSLTLDWPRGATEAELAYLLSGSAVQYLVQGSGERGLDVLLPRWRETGDFEEAFRRTFGYTSGTFESNWLRHVRRRYGWILMLTQTAVFWLFAGLALLVLWRWRVRRNRLRLARLRASQPPTRPAYWQGPPTPPIGGFR